MKQRNVKITVAYDGSAFFGFQKQPSHPTIQAELERAASLVLGEKVCVIGSGRTDTGVHAFGQVVALRTSCPIPVDKLIFAMNRILPGAIRVLEAEEVDASFHPRFSAKKKHYRYLIKPVITPSPFLERYFCQVEGQLNIDKMKQGAEKFLGEHDFSAFTKSPGQVKNPIRKIFISEISLERDVIIYDVIGNGFLHNMVRNMARALINIGLSQMEPNEIVELYRNQDRRRLGPPAPPSGLYLMRVMY